MTKRNAFYADDLLKGGVASTDMNLEFKVPKGALLNFKIAKGSQLPPNEEACKVIKDKIDPLFK